MSMRFGTNLNKMYNFEGLADVTKLPTGSPDKYFPAKYFLQKIDQDSEYDGHPKGLYCVTSGTYRLGKRGDAETVVAIAIGLWDEERNCFSVLKKMKDGKSLPLPFTVKVDKSIDKKKQAVQMRISSEKILKKLGDAQSLEDVLEEFEKEARANQ